MPEKQRFIEFGGSRKVRRVKDETAEKARPAEGGLRCEAFRWEYTRRKERVARGITTSVFEA